MSPSADSSVLPSVFSPESSEAGNSSQDSSPDSSAAPVSSASPGSSVELSITLSQEHSGLHYPQYCPHHLMNHCSPLPFLLHVIYTLQSFLHLRVIIVLLGNLLKQVYDGINLIICKSYIVIIGDIYNNIVKTAYTQQDIDLHTLIFDDKAYEIDHIIPISISLDDSLSNKVLASRLENQQKGNLTPMMAYLKGKFTDGNLERYKLFVNSNNS